VGEVLELLDQVSGHLRLEEEDLILDLKSLLVV
jgi:hypothetical protein